MTTIRFTGAFATSAILMTVLASSGCVSTGKLQAPQWLSFKKEKTAEAESGLPDPSTLAVPTTVTQPGGSGTAHDPSQGFAATSAPNVTVPNVSVPTSGTASNPDTNAAVTFVPANSYPSTNQPAPTGATTPAGFLPSSNGPSVAMTTQPPATSGATGDVQEGPYGANDASSVELASATASPPPTAEPMPTGGPVGTTTWDQPVSAPYPESSVSSPNALANTTQPSSDGGSIYGNAMSANGASTNDNIYGDPSISHGSTNPVGSAEPGSYTPPPGELPSVSAQSTTPTPDAHQSSTGIAPASYDAPAANSHYGQMARGATADNRAWRPGSTTEYMPTITR